MWLRLTGRIVLCVLVLGIGCSVMLLQSQPFNSLNGQQQQEFQKAKAEWINAGKPIPAPLYFLPYPKGDTYVQAQAWFGETTHAGVQNYHAYDF
jgi:hypothetical protein